MIAYLAGELIIKLDDAVILKSATVGYLVFLTPKLISSLPLNSKTELFIHTHVKDDAIELYGFVSLEEVRFFKLLLGVSGIGPRTALAILNIPPQEVRAAIVKADVDFFTRIPRLGKKGAQKIIIDLKQKLGEGKELDLSDITGADQEIVDALLSMGFTRSEAKTAVGSIPDTETRIEEKIRIALRLIKPTGQKRNE